MKGTVELSLWAAYLLGLHFTLFSRSVFSSGRQTDFNSLFTLFFVCDAFWIFLDSLVTDSLDFEFTVTYPLFITIVLFFNNSILIKSIEKKM